MVNFMLRTINLKMFSLISVSLLFLVGCNFFTPTKKEAQLVIINVLDKTEFDDCHIKGSIHIPFSEFEKKIASFDKNNHYVLYCADYACMSSGYCAKLLRDAKFDHVWEYSGGMVDWYQKGYPIEGSATEDYLKFKNINFNDEENPILTITAEELLAKIKEFQHKK